MIGRLQDPPSARELGVKMLKKAAVEAVGIEKAAAFQPAVVGGNAVGAYEALALEHVGGDVRALLGRVDRDRVERVELGDDHVEQCELQADPPLAQRYSETATPRGRGVHELKETRCNRVRVLQNQAVQKRRS